MAILTNQEAADALNYDTTDQMPSKVLSIFLPAVNEYLKSATGKDWGTTTTTYTTIDPVAKMAAVILLVRWFENPGEMGKASGIGVIGMIAQLGAKYQQELQL